VATSDLRRDTTQIRVAFTSPLEWITARENLCLVGPAGTRGLRTALTRIASHWPFEAWGRFLPEHTTAVSLLDRLLHHANVVVTEGDSYRMREAKTRGAAAPETR